MAEDEQRRRFEEAAKAAECDESAENFEQALKKITKKVEKKSDEERD